jgi:hypothetical protein
LPAAVTKYSPASIPSPPKPLKKSSKPPSKISDFLIRLRALRGGEKLLFTRKEVFPLPAPLPFSRKAEYFEKGASDR